MTDAYDRWLAATGELTANTAELQKLQERRYRYATEVGALLTHAEPHGQAVTGAVLYGVVSQGPGLIYIGQTTDAQRRLRDLCVGESHHLANTVPPEGLSS